MFSCFQAVRLTIESLERRLSLLERLRRFGHLLICRHCRRHSKQIHGLAFALGGHGEAAALDLPRLSAVARSRISAAMADTDSN
jgi:hypothetical protein